VPPAVAEKAMEIGEKALEKQFEIMEQQQQKAGEFINKKVRTAYRPSLFLTTPSSLQGAGERKDVAYSYAVMSVIPVLS